MLRRVVFLVLIVISLSAAASDLGAQPAQASKHYDGLLVKDAGVIAIYFNGPKPDPALCTVRVQFSGLIAPWYDHYVRALEFPNAVLEEMLTIDVSGIFNVPQSAFDQPVPGLGVVLKAHEWRNLLQQEQLQSEVEFLFFQREKHTPITQRSELRKPAELDLDIWRTDKVRLVEATVPYLCSDRDGGSRNGRPHPRVDGG